MRRTVAIVLALVSRPVFGAEGADKAGYTLLNPTPADKMREFTTDRPDQTEAPYTVDAGHFQLEADIYNTTRDRNEDRGNSITTTSTTVMSVNFKVGLTNDMDFQIVHGGQVSDEAKPTGAAAHKEKGLGDTTVRLKANLWGNDGGNTAFGLMPFAKLPTASNKNMGNRAVEYGLIVPLAFALPGEFGLGTMIEVDWMKNAADDKRHTEATASASLSRDLIGAVGGYAEILVSRSQEKGAETAVQGDIGLTCGVTETVQVDAGVNLGLNDAAPDTNPFAGISVRF